MNLSEYIKFDGTDLAKLIKNKEVSKQELVEISFSQLDIANRQINAVTHKRKESVLKEIKGKDKNRPFEGVPIFLKGLSQKIQGELDIGGARLLKEQRASVTSNFVKSLHSAGFLSLGYSTTPEFGIKNITEPKLYGPTCNPWNPEYSPGGSSGGAAALVASGVVPIAGASDGGGSIRIPASFCSLFGLKPTRGRIPIGPGVGRQSQGAAISFVLTRTVRDAARLLTSMQIVQQEAAFQIPLFQERFEDAMKRKFQRKMKIGFTTNSPVGTPVSDDAKQAVGKVVTWLEEQGHEVEEVDNTIDGIQLMRDYYLMNSVGIATLIQQLEKMIDRKIHADDVEIETWLLNLAGKNVSAVGFSKSLASWDKAAAKMAELHQTYDFYVTPTTGYHAPEIGELTHSEEKEATLRDQIETTYSTKQQELIYEMFLPSLAYTPFTQLANLTGQPAVSVPVHLTKDGLPLGVHIMAPKGEESKLLQLAYQLEQTELWIGMKGNPYF